jgi:hypothetical protein
MCSSVYASSVGRIGLTLFPFPMKGLKQKEIDIRDRYTGAGQSGEYYE